MLMLIATATTTTGSGSGSRNLFPFILILGLAAVWLIFIRPQRRKQKLQQSKLSELAVGDEVITAGGVYAKVTRIDDDGDVRVEIAPNVEVRLARRAIAAQLTEPAVAATAETTEPEDASDERWQSAFDAESGDEKPG